MPYKAQITRSAPSCLLILVDQSGSMDDPCGGAPGSSKAAYLVDAINKCLMNLITTCTRSDGVAGYFDIGVIGYTTDDKGNPEVGSALQGPLAGTDLVSVSALSDAPARIDERTKKVPDGAGGLIDVTVRMPVWVDPVHRYGTPMVAAVEYAHTVLERWISAHPDNFPPIVLHFTDGESTDGDPVAAATRVTDLATSDGNVLLFNCHVASSQDFPVLFPDSEASLPPGNAEAKCLYEISSQFPQPVVDEAVRVGYMVTASCRGFAFNADAVAIVQFLTVGTQKGTMR